MQQKNNINTIICPFCKSENPDVSICITCGRKIKGEKLESKDFVFRRVFEKIVEGLDLNRLISAIIGIIYLITATYLKGGMGFFGILKFLILPLGCIWYGEDLGNYTGSILSQGISRPSSGRIVIFAGWLLLFLPIFQVVYVYFAIGEK